MEGGSEVAARCGGAEPSAVVAVGRRGVEHREVSVLGAGVRFAEEPLDLYRRLLRVGYVAVADHDLLGSELREVGASVAPPSASM